MTLIPLPPFSLRDLVMSIIVAVVVWLAYVASAVLILRNRKKS